MHIISMINQEYCINSFGTSGIKGNESCNNLISQSEDEWA